MITSTGKLKAFPLSSQILHMGACEFNRKMRDNRMKRPTNCIHVLILHAWGCHRKEVKTEGSRLGGGGLIIILTEKINCRVTRNRKEGRGS